MAETAKRQRAPDPIRDTQREIAAAAELRAQILALAEGDEDFARDVIEGETDLREQIEGLVASDGDDGALVDGITIRIKALQERRERIEKRIELRRALMLQGLTAAGLSKLECPAGTVSVRPVAPTAIVLTEAEIPSRFWKQAAPTVDKRALLAALKEGAVPGATLSNGSETVQVRS